ncbi:hypothetical protein QOZ95_002286 [Paenibacillus brasilensis]|uniref:Uncharacterized protein n=1 Tax=Paenibacillus brasilensis TaxID=128574 RepID=A0ABU0L0W2_9BACL|nr:hypothetical protein [Paenibacillus brasilensis]
MKGKGYPQWVQDLLLQFKKDYYKAVAAGDKKGAKEAAAKAKQLRQQVAEIDRILPGPEHKCMNTRPSGGKHMAPTIKPSKSRCIFSPAIYVTMC